jgi:DNA-binding MarR family transcriptional regulator
VRSSEDRRVVNIELTREGREAARKIPAVICEVQNSFLQGLSVAEWQQLKDMLRRILANGLALQGETQGQE